MRSHLFVSVKEFILKFKELLSSKTIAAKSMNLLDGQLLDKVVVFLKSCTR